MENVNKEKMVLDLLRNYLEGALSVKVTSEHGKALQDGIRMVQSALQRFENMYEVPEKTA